MKKEIIICLAGGLAVLAVGFVFGANSRPKEWGGKTDNSISSLLGSKAVKEISVVVSGDVKTISGLDLVIQKDGDEKAVSFQATATVSRLLPPEKDVKTTQPAVMEEIKLEEIKVGDQVNVLAKMKNGGLLEGYSLVVFPK